jgi:hypothetical protein
MVALTDACSWLRAVVLVPNALANRAAVVQTTPRVAHPLSQRRRFVAAFAPVYVYPPVVSVPHICLAHFCERDAERRGDSRTWKRRAVGAAWLL